jgi:hypothetical protein
MNNNLVSNEVLATMSDKELLLLSPQYPRTGDRVKLNTGERSILKGTSGVVVELDESGEYGVDWDKHGTVWWFDLSDFVGFEGRDHPLEYHDVEE